MEREWQSLGVTVYDPPAQEVTMARRRTHLQVIKPDENTFALSCDGHAILSGDGEINEDLVCGRCHRTLFMALSREDVFTAIARKGLDFRDRHGRRHPMVAHCDCGAFNLVWPPPIT
jgi:hypothetical protein